VYERIKDKKITQRSPAEPTMLTHFRHQELYLNGVCLTTIEVHGVELRSLIECLATRSLKSATYVTYDLCNRSYSSGFSEIDREK
jgi:hypothetical protein